MLRLDNAKVSLGERSFCFSLKVARGEIVAVVGKSGSGKSTLLNLISGFLPVGSGEITWDGESLISTPVDKRPVTTLFQSDNLFNHLSIRKNVGLGMDPGLALSATQWNEIEQSLANVGLAGMGGRLPGELSGGEQQRVGLARCLVRQQPVLLLDEPYSALDLATRQKMLELTRGICNRQNLCTLMVSHSPEDCSILGATRVKLENDTIVSHFQGSSEG